jgi:hypothetical protein
MNNWQPRPSDIAWTQNLIDKMKDGGIWGIPRASSVWRFDKTNKVMVQIYGDADEPDNEALRIICPLIGWTTAYRPEPMTPEQVQAAMTDLTAETAGSGKTINRASL